jgi:capsular exopolysaccharide synthesis family protein
MERIKQALERARQEQVRNMGAGVVHPLAPVDSPESQITYSETRVTAVSPSVLKKHRIITGTETDEVTAAYKILRTQVLQRMVSKGWNALAVTSPGPGQGKTVTAINLAISLAREVHHTVLLVDLDMRRPSIHRYLGLKAEVGISDVLTKGTPVSHALVNPGIDRLVVLPGREALPNSSELLKSPRMVQLVKELKSRYLTRLIIFDLPPLLSVDDAIAFAPYVDAALVVVAEGLTTREELQHASTLLANTPVVGTVLNRSSQKATPYFNA